MSCDDFAYISEFIAPPTSYGLIQITAEQRSVLRHLKHDHFYIRESDSTSNSSGDSPNPELACQDSISEEEDKNHDNEDLYDHLLRNIKLQVSAESDKDVRIKQYCELHFALRDLVAKQPAFEWTNGRSGTLTNEFYEPLLNADGFFSSRRDDFMCSSEVSSGKGRESEIDTDNTTSWITFKDHRTRTSFGSPPVQNTRHGVMQRFLRSYRQQDPRHRLTYSDSRKYERRSLASKVQSIYGDADDVLLSELEDVETRRRKRRRRRHNAPTPLQVQIPSSSLAAEPRKRGRPRKYPIPIGKINTNQSQATCKLVNIVRPNNPKSAAVLGFTERRVQPLVPLVTTNVPLIIASRPRLQLQSPSLASQKSSQSISKNVQLLRVQSNAAGCRMNNALQGNSNNATASQVSTIRVINSLSNAPARQTSCSAPLDNAQPNGKEVTSASASATARNLPLSRIVIHSANVKHEYEAKVARQTVKTDSNLNERCTARTSTPSQSSVQVHFQSRPRSETSALIKCEPCVNRSNTHSLLLVSNLDGQPSECECECGCVSVSATDTELKQEESLQHDPHILERLRPKRAIRLPSVYYQTLQHDGPCQDFTTQSAEQSLLPTVTSAYKPSATSSIYDVASISPNDGDQIQDRSSAGTEMQSNKLVHLQISNQSSVSHCGSSRFVAAPLFASPYGSSSHEAANSRMNCFTINNLHGEIQQLRPRRYDDYQSSLGVSYDDGKAQCTLD